MWSLGVVLDPPVLDRSARVCHREEPVLVQAFVAELAIEALDVRVFDRLAETDEAQTHPHCYAQASSTGPSNSGPWSTVIDSGRPRGGHLSWS